MKKVYQGSFPPQKLLPALKKCCMLYNNRPKKQEDQVCA